MGMYTELVLKAEIDNNAPELVWDVCWFLFGDGDQPDRLPEHPFFECCRWSMIGRSCSYYHHPSPVSDMVKRGDIGEGAIFSRSDLKNYEGEIELFLDWIGSYIETYGERRCLGWTWYEEADAPTLVYVGGE